MKCHHKMLLIVPSD